MPLAKSTRSRIAGNTQKNKFSELNKYPIKPMLATLADTTPIEEGWLYEIKWDGYRAISILNKKEVHIFSRNQKSFDEKFYPIYEVLKQWNINAIVDGEIIVMDKNGMPNFSALQQWRSEADGQLVYYLFDLLWKHGKNLMDMPLEERRNLLKKILPNKNNFIRFSENFNSDAKHFFELADKMGLEGIMAKKSASIYSPGSRSKDWLKIKTSKQQEAIICGYTNNENSKKPFSALLLGVYENKKLEFIGPVGTGFSIKDQELILQKLKKHKTGKCPFAIVPDYNKPSRFRPDPPKAEVTWVKPAVVCEITYRELTPDKALRHPSFKGFREDKKAANIGWEVPLPISNDKTLHKHKIIPSPSKQERKTLLNPTDETQERSINDHALKFGNLSKVYWPASVKHGLKTTVSKRDMINYYYQVAPFILPYLKDRPETLNRYPNGISGEAFYQKDVKGKVPAWIKTFPYHSETDGRDKEFLVCNDEASLLYMASLGCIEMNPWHSKTTNPGMPDWCIIDLDPDKNTFNQVIEAALVTKKILDAIGVSSYCKTSGSTGLHIYIPLGGKYDYEMSKEFGRSIATKVHSEIPSYTSIERQVKNRSGKMYIDFLQNRPQATVSAPYSLRPKPGATVSMPLHWEEVKKGLKMTDFNILNSIARINNEGDIFKAVLGKAANLKKAILALSKI
ncbi:MAG: DNA ligase D [Ferruginibacter sp.]